MNKNITFNVQSMGGKATAIISRKRALDNYYKSPNACFNCNKVIEVKKNERPSDTRERKFCCQSCSASFNNKKRIENGFSKKGTVKKSICVVCGKEIEISSFSSHKKAKCKECVSLVVKNNKTYPVKCICCGKDFLSSKKNSKCCSLSCSARIGVKVQSQNRRSKSEIYFSELCDKDFKNIKTNEPMFNGWDADIILNDQKIAVLWNGKWHYEKITNKHSVLQVQNRDLIKIKEIIKFGYKPYVIKDVGKFRKWFVEKEYENFIKWMKEEHII